MQPLQTCLCRHGSLQRGRTRWSAECAGMAVRRAAELTSFNGAALVGVRNGEEIEAIQQALGVASTGPHSLECGMSLPQRSKPIALRLQRGRTRWSAE